MLPLEHSAILFTCAKLNHLSLIFVLSFFEWPLNDGLVLEEVDKTLTSSRTSPSLSSDDAKILESKAVSSANVYYNVMFL